MGKNNYKDDTKVTKENKLPSIIQADSKLSDAQKKEFKAMAELFSLDFKENLQLASIELDEKYDCGIDEWKAFLQYPPIQKYLTSFKQEKMLNQIDGLIADGKGGAGILKAKEAIRSSQNDNSMLILFRLPEKVEVFEGDYDNGIVG